GWRGRAAGGGEGRRGEGCDGDVGDAFDRPPRGGRGARRRTARRLQEAGREPAGNARLALMRRQGTMVFHSRARPEAGARSMVLASMLKTGKIGGALPPVARRMLVF